MVNRGGNGGKVVRDRAVTPGLNAALKTSYERINTLVHLISPSARGGAAGPCRAAAEEAACCFASQS